MHLTQAITVDTNPASKKQYAAKYYEGATFPLPFHNHAYFELTLILQGRGMRFIGDNVEEFAEGEVLLIGPYLSHQWNVEGYANDNQMVKAISIFFEEDFPSSDFNRLDEMREIQALKEKARYGVKLYGTLLEDIAKRIPLLVGNEGMNTLLELLGILTKIAVSQQYKTLSSLKMGASSNLTDERVQKITELIKSNLHRKITLEELAEVACMHKGSLGRFFKQSVGFTPIEYTNLLRIGKACELLIGSSDKIGNIAFHCGFDNLSHFNRLFKKVKGITPLAYRERKLGTRESVTFKL